ncbi:DUF5063 domain-containing protein [Sporolactobacillus pectinivorans]|uniref:DUF5063 domain-containing protein n=1 Tax=Sporolactobacillus pectinivorans TaxID=1591408 RepID=UPI000C269EC4|nr:DUF5063 domain-containing protein [Sporolactobacillus pectinivorans]
MNKARTRDFYKSANDFCDFVDLLGRCKNRNKFNKLLKNLLRLYHKGLDLPQVTLETSKSTKVDVSYPKLKIKKYDTYWEVFNPYQPDEPIQGSLTDDISDIYHDLKEGISLYEQKKYKEAVWHWKFNFEMHWGAHAIDAMRALHYLINRDIYLA